MLFRCVTLFPPRDLIPDRSPLGDYSFSIRTNLRRAAPVSLEIPIRGVVFCKLKSEES
jgi:hypothetical protein